MEIPVKSASGEIVSHIGVSEALFNAPINEALIHQILVGQQANRRQGTASTKTRGQVSGGGRKPRPQKGSGRSRQGSIRSPQWRHGGIVFGPHPRDYRQRLPKKMRRVALRGVLSAKLKDGCLIVVDDFGLDQPRTRQMAGVLEALGAVPSAVVVTREANANLVKSARNLEKVWTLPAHNLNVLDLLAHKYVVMTVEAVRKAEEMWGEAQSEPEETASGTPSKEG